MAGGYCCQKADPNRDVLAGSNTKTTKPPNATVMTL